MSKRVTAQDGKIELIVADGVSDIDIGADGSFAGSINLGTKLSLNETTGVLSFPSNTTEFGIVGDESPAITFRNTTITTDAATLTFTDDPSGYDTITRAGGVSDFVTEGFKPGMMVTVSGTASNDGTYSIDEKGVAPTTLTLIFDDPLVTEGPVAATMVGLVRETNIENGSALKLSSLDGTFKTTIRHKDNAWLEIRDPDLNGAGIFTYGSGVIGIYDSNETVSSPPVNTDTPYSVFSGYSAGDYINWEIGAYNIGNMGLSLNNWVPDSSIEAYVVDVTESFYRRIWYGNYSGGVQLYWPTSNAVALSTDAAGIYSPLGSLYLAEKGTPGGDTLTRGQLWVRDDNPQTLMFTDGDSTDFVVAGGGVPTVFSTGTPADNQVAVWTATTNTLEGDANFTWTGTTLAIAGAGAQLLLPLENEASTPTLGFGDGDTGFFETSDDVLRLAIGTLERFQWDTNQFEGVAGNAPAFVNTTPSTTVPSLRPNKTDTDTGIGHGTDQLSLIAGGVEGIRLTEASSSVIQTHEANVGLTADVGSAQGSGVITSTYNVYSTVATAGDAATLPSTFPVGTVIYVKNDGANSMDVFPASGDDAGAGLNTAVAVDAGTSKTFVATTADSTWTTLIDGGGSSSVFATGTPLDNQVAIFTDANTIEGDANFTWSGTALTLAGAGVQLLLPLDNDAATPTLAFGDGDSGFYQNQDNRLAVAVGGGLVAQFISGDVISAGLAAGPVLRNQTPTSTVPTVCASANDNNTGMGWAEADNISLITGGVQARRLTAATAQTTDATQTEIISIAVASGTTFGYRINIVGNEAATGDTVFESIFGAIHNQGGTTAIVGSDIVDRTEDAGAAAWVVTVAADDGTDSLTVDVTGEAAHTIDWKVSVEILDV